MPKKITPYITKDVVSLDENKTVLDAAMEMKVKYIGSIVVTGESGVLGLFTERDVTMKVVGKGKDPDLLILKDYVDKDQVTVSPDEKCSACLELMKKHRCRHLLVKDGDQFVGIVTIRGIIQLMLEEKEELIGHLEKYITGSL